MNARDALNEFEQLEMKEVNDLDLQIAHKNSGEFVINQFNINNN